MLKLILLGAIQGMTEFLPVSSSGHLVIIQRLLGLHQNLVFLDISLHIGTLLALVTFFFKDILAACKDAKLILRILIATVVTGIIGLVFKKVFESFFTSPALVSVLLIVNGLLILATGFIKKGGRLPNYADSALMGISQGIAITPGISRSGATICTLLARKVDPREAFRFSFLASIPAILGALLLETKDTDWTKITEYHLLDIATGVATAYTFGILAMFLLKKSLLSGRFHAFGYYCVLAGTTFLFFAR
jgi:undecaprenyl-diphosphatase